MISKTDVLYFIDKFKFIHQKEVEELFLCGDCYYFAIILKSRFPNAKILYDQVVGHFITDINGRQYDILGDVTDKYTNTISYDEMPDIEKSRLIRDCVEFRTR